MTILNKRNQNLDRQLFLAGIKPAQLTNETVRLDLFNEYPYLNIKQGTIVFQNEDLCNNYRAGKDDGKIFSSHRKLGVALGYPPQAAADFSEQSFAKLQFADKVAIKTMISVFWHGFTFHCYPENFEACLGWMEETYNLPQPLQFGIDVKFLSLGRHSGKVVPAKAVKEARESNRQQRIDYNLSKMPDLFN